MAITSAICTSFKEEIFNGVHQPADVYKIALYSNAASLDAATTVYSASDEVVGDGYVAGGAALSGFTTGRGGTTAWITFDDVVWLNSTITARGALIYNSSRSGKAVCTLNFGSDIADSDGAFLIHWPNADASNALIRYA